MTSALAVSWSSCVHINEVPFVSVAFQPSPSVFSRRSSFSSVCFNRQGCHPIRTSFFAHVLPKCTLHAPQSASSTSPSIQVLRRLLSSGKTVKLPCCHDGLSARLITRAEFPAAFLSGFCVSAAYGIPDVGLLSFSELKSVLLQVISSIPESFPIIVDADAGYGGGAPANIQRTIFELARCGAAGMLIEDQIEPKRCGHVQGKRVVNREDAMRRMRAALDARDECQGDKPVVIARTDAAAVYGMDEAIERAKLFAEMGADVTFVEAPRNVAELERIGKEVPGIKMANMLEGGVTPLLDMQRLHEMGFGIVAYPLTVLSAGVRAQEEALKRIRDGKETHTLIKTFEELKNIVGFDRYLEIEQRYQ